MGNQSTTFDHLHLRVARPRATRPRHHVGSAIDLATLVAPLEESPDGVVVLVRHREIRVGPVHPIPEPNRLLRLNPGVLSYTLLALFDEAVDPELLDLAFRGETEFLLDLDLDPEPLAVEAVLVPELAPVHRPVALKGVLQCATPGVMDTHGIVCRDRSVEERPVLLTTVFTPQLLERGGLVPELEHSMFELDEIEPGIDLSIHFFSLCSGRNRSGRPRRARKPTGQEANWQKVLR